MTGKPFILRFGEFTLDLERRGLFLGQERIHLTPKPLETLVFLVENRGTAVEKQKILDAVWKDAFVTEDNLVQAVREIRRALGDDKENPRFVLTVPRVGYRFVGEVSTHDDESTAPAGLGDGEARSSAPDAIAASFQARWRRRIQSTLVRRWALGITLLAAAAAVASVFWIGSRPTLSFSARDWILVADFDNQTGNPLFDKSLGAAFAVSLEQSPHANLFPRSRIAGTLKRMGKSAEERINEETAREICLRENLRGLISCSISRFGKQYAVSAQLIDPHSGETVRSYYERVMNQDRILTAIDKIAGSIRRDLGESLSSISGNTRVLPQVTTASLQALKLYADGMYLWNRGQYLEAVEVYDSALKYDPDFAKAHAELGSAYCSFVFNNPVKGKSHLERALQLSERTTYRERLGIEIAYEHSLGHTDEAIRRYNIYLASYPDDSRIRFNFGNLLMRNDRPEEAIRQFQEVLRIVPDSVNAFINLATTYTNMGRSRDSLQNYEKAFALEPERMTQGNLNHEYGFALVQSGDLKKADEVFASALRTPIRPAALRSLGLLRLYQGRYREAVEIIGEATLLSTTITRARNHLFMSMALEGQGRRTAAIGELDRAVTSLAGLGPQTAWIATIGIGYARCGALEKCARIRDRVREEADRDDPYQCVYLHLLEGEVQLSRDNQKGALESFLLADRAGRTPLTVESLARAYLRSGAIDQAIEMLEALVGMQGRSIGWEAQQSWIAAHYRLARAYLSQGEKEEALKAVNGLLELWKDADPDLPLLKESRRLLRSLKTGAPGA